MESLKKNKVLIIFCIILFIVSFFVLSFYNKEGNYNRESTDDVILKNYKENEYIPVNITYDQMARIYLQDYVYKLLYNREEAYNVLDIDYRNARFSSFEDFDSYIDSIMSKKLQEMTVSKYALTDGTDYRDYDVYDSGDNLFIFREKGVMQYTVFFDRYTVDMN